MCVRTLSLGLRIRPLRERDPALLWVFCCARRSFVTQVQHCRFIVVHGRRLCDGTLLVPVHPHQSANELCSAELNHFIGPSHPQQVTDDNLREPELVLGGALCKLGSDICSIPQRELKYDEMSNVVDSIQAWDVCRLSQAYQISNPSLPSLMTTQPLRGSVFQTGGQNRGRH